MLFSLNQIRLLLYNCSEECIIQVNLYKFTVRIMIKKTYSNIRDMNNQPDTLLPLECNQVNMVVGDEQ